MAHFDENYDYFQVIEQPDGRYIVVEIFGKRSKMFTSRQAETILPWEADCRSFEKAYSAIATMLTESGEYLDQPTIITHARGRS